MSRRIFTTGFAAGLAAILSVYATGGDKDLFYRNQPRASAPQEAPVMVSGGSGLIERALVEIVPAPYKVYLDDSVPPTMMLIWGRGDNWMEVLKRALAPVGLVAKPDWAKNSVTVAWRVESPAVQAPSYAVAAAPAAPSAPLFTVSDPVQQPSTRMSGGFDVVQPAPERVAVPAPVAKREPAMTSVIGQEIIAGRNGELPKADDMWTLMKAAVSGKRIVVSGRSNMRNEDTRMLFANRYATKARESLLAVGFPSHLVVINERGGYLASKPRVTLSVVQGEI